MKQNYWFKIEQSKSIVQFINECRFVKKMIDKLYKTIQYRIVPKMSIPCVSTRFTESFRPQLHCLLLHTGNIPVCFQHRSIDGDAAHAKNIQ